MSAWAPAAAIGGDLIGTMVGQGEARSQRHEDRMAQSRNIAMQKEFAQNSIRWKMEDAKRAGISPLAALGATGTSFSPIAVGSDNQGPSTGDFIARTGQNISRAISSTSTAEERMLQKLQLATAQADLDGKVIENQFKASQLKNLQGTPSFPGSDNMMPGQGNSPVIKIKPSERTASQAGIPAQDAGWITDRAFSNTGTGFHPVPSADVTERIEDKLVPEMLWSLRNYLMPNFGDPNGMPSKSQLPEGYDSWKWNSLKFEWQPSKLAPEYQDRKDYAPHQTRAQKLGYKTYQRKWMKGGK